MVRWQTGSYHRYMMDRLGQLYLRGTTATRCVLLGESGASIVEYGLLIALIAMVAFASVVLFGDAVASMWNGSADSVVNA
ncbi:MAG: hypothetical protein BMS9Abin12_1503 [Acidimicrobiia bacterium]|nr:MAG: hypothetical protein BMS9Abin12_1503 [Acidimicrobiia bacterium]